MLASIAQLVLRLGGVRNSPWTIEDLGDLFQAVTAGLRESEVRHAEEYNQETADYLRLASFIFADQQSR